MSLSPSSIRSAILDRLSQAAPFSVPVHVLRASLKQAGLQLEASELAFHLSALGDASLAAVERDPLDPDLKRWRLTELGRSYLASL